MSTRAAHCRDIVRVRVGTYRARRHLGGMYLTVTDVHDGLVDAAEWTGGPLVTLPASDVDVITPNGVVR